jgi:hypothetical protein
LPQVKKIKVWISKFSNYLYAFKPAAMWKMIARQDTAIDMQQTTGK